MSTDQKYSCTTEFGAEYLMHFGVLLTGFSVLPQNLLDPNLMLSAAYAILLPLMSYLFSVAKQSNPEGRAQLILVEIISICGVPIFSWGLVKSAEQLVRLLWVGFLVYTYTPTQGIRASLFVLCIYFFVYEILKGIAFYKGKRSRLMGKNPKLIHNYVKKIMVQDDLRTTPLNNCYYIVMGEENHEIDDCSNGYSLGKKKSNSEGMLTIGRVFQLNLPKADTCISLALAKMLMRRLAIYMVLIRDIITLLHYQSCSNLKFLETYLKNPANWNRSYRSEAPSKKELPKAQGENTMKAKKCSSVLEAATPSLLPKWIRSQISRSSFLRVYVSTDATEAILRFLRQSGGQLTNGETSLRKYGMEHLNWACKPNGSNTEAILVWHIATTLLHCLEPPPQQNNNPFTEEAALELSSYCHYLVSDLPELLPDDVKWTKKMYANVMNDILDFPRSSDRCKYALLTMWHQSSVVGKGVTLAKELMNCAEEGTQVWTMLAHFWVEMMLFIAPSDNVEGHEKILDQNELITQLWALLTHAGIITRPKPTEN